MLVGAESTKARHVTDEGLTEFGCLIGLKLRSRKITIPGFCDDNNSIALHMYFLIQSDC